MVTERLLVNIRLRLWATWPFKYEDGWRVCVGGELFTISRKTRIEILRVASTLKYTNSSFQHFHCLFESETINPVNTHQTISVQSFHSLISAVQNRFKLLQCHLSISLLRGGKERLYPPHSISGGCCVMVVETPPYVKTTLDLQITNYTITIIQSYLPRNVPHARVGGLGDGVQNIRQISGGSGCTQICQQKWTVWGGEGEGAQNASTRICNLPISQVFKRKRKLVGGVGWSVKGPIIPIYTFNLFLMGGGSY